MSMFAQRLVRYGSLLAVALIFAAGSGAPPVRAQEGIILRILPYESGGCSIGDGSTFFGFDLEYDTPVDLTYTLLVIPGGVAGLRGSAQGEIEAGSSDSYHISATFDSIATPGPWSFTVQLDGYFEGALVTRATAEVACPPDGIPFSVTPLTFTNRPNTVYVTVREDTPIYWAPRPDAASGIIFAAGREVRLVDVDPDAEFHQLRLLSIVFWIPADAIEFGGSP